ncbi:MAG: DUF4154 domain-containing protein [Bacteroidetes bacterium]|nr:MAG: DUF4154 domain-containing protein [Bacteroidota bacterium]TAG85465.1 MAG: DUF4154 domain-containing protein [Bacteroidota bacterium]
MVHFFCIIIIINYFCPININKLKKQEKNIYQLFYNLLNFNTIKFKSLYIIFFFLLFSTFLTAQTGKDFSQKTVNIVRFLTHLNFPLGTSISDEFIVGIIGDDEVVKNMTINLNIERARGKKIIVKNIESFKQIYGVHLLYYSKSGSQKILLGRVFREVDGKPIIFVTEEGKDYLQKGTDFNFLNPKGTWRYEINVARLEAKGFTMSEEIKNKAVNIEEQLIAKQMQEKKELIVKVSSAEEARIKAEKAEAERKIAEAEAENNRLVETIKKINPVEQQRLLNKYNEVMEGLTKQEQINEFIKLESRAEASKMAAQNAKDKAKRDREFDAANAQQKLIITAGSIAVLFMALVATIFFIFSVKRKRVIKKLEATQLALSHKIEEINDKNEQIESQNALLISQTSALLESTKKTEDSIRYAYTIQQAMLPPLKKLEKSFPDHFLLYEPKDIVSGDFYWFSELNQYKFVVVADCTGHGVPGAFMSMIGINLLNEIINQKYIIEPSQILENLHQGIIEGLRQRESNNIDGMDISLIRIEKKTEQESEMVFGAAKRSIYFTQKGVLRKLTGDNKYVGGLKKEEKVFTNQIVNIYKGDWVYLFSDGYVDSPNLSKVKLGTLKLEETITQIKSHHKDIQRDVLFETLDKHRGDAKSRDDITFLGIRV